MLPSLQLYLGAMKSAFAFMQAAQEEEEEADEAAEERWLQLCQRVVQVHTGFNASQVRNTPAKLRLRRSCQITGTVACCLAAAQEVDLEPSWHGHDFKSILNVELPNLPIIIGHRVDWSCSQHGATYIFPYSKAPAVYCLLLHCAVRCPNAISS